MNKHPVTQCSVFYVINTLSTIGLTMHTIMQNTIVRDSGSCEL